MKTKRAYCSSCSTGSHHPIWDATKPFDVELCDWTPMWECRSCHQTMPRRVVAKKPTALSALLASSEDFTMDDVFAALRADRR